MSSLGDNHADCHHPRLCLEIDTPRCAEPACSRKMHADRRQNCLRLEITTPIAVSSFHDRR